MATNDEGNVDATSPVDDQPIGADHRNLGGGPRIVVFQPARTAEEQARLDAALAEFFPLYDPKK